MSALREINWAALAVTMAAFFALIWLIDGFGTAVQLTVVATVAAVAVTVVFERSRK